MDELLNTLPVYLRLLAVVGIGGVFSFLVFLGKRHQVRSEDGDIRQMLTTLIDDFKEHEIECRKRSEEVKDRLYKVEGDVNVLYDRSGRPKRHT